MIPQPGLPLGFLLFVKGIGWSCTSGRFPQRRRLVPPAPAARFPQNSILAAQKHLGFKNGNLRFLTHSRDLGAIPPPK